MAVQKNISYKYIESIYKYTNTYRQANNTMPVISEVNHCIVVTLMTVFQK